MKIDTIAEYVRISSEDDDLKSSDKLESNSISNQRNLLDSYIRSIPEFSTARVVEFCDDGWSGKNFDRPAVQEMLSQAKQGKIQCIIVKDMSRFGRDYLIVENYISRVFPFLGVRFIAVNDGIDSIRPEDVDSLDTSFRALLYDLYSRDISRKVRSALRLRAKQGDFIASHAPYGYLKDPNKKNHVIIDPPAAAVVRRIFHMVANGSSALQVAQALNRECIPTPMCYKQAAGCTRTVWNCVHGENFWTNHTVVKIIRDERYLGKVVFGKRFYDVVGGHHCVKVSKKDWIVAENTHEGIVTQEEFNQAQSMLREFYEKNVTPGTRMLRGKIRCGICGHIMHRIDVKEPYYICFTPRATVTYACPSERILEQDIVDLLLDGLRIQAEAAVELERIWEEQHRQEKADAAAMRKNLSEMRENLNRQANRAKDLYTQYGLGEISKAEYLAIRANAMRERDRIAARITELEAALENIGENGRLQNHFISSFKKYTEAQELTREIVADVLERVTVYSGDRLNIVWNYGEEFKELMLDIAGTQHREAELNITKQ